MSFWAQWPHTATTTMSKTGLWTFGFQVFNIAPAGGIVAGAFEYRPGTIGLNEILFGVRLRSLVSPIPVVGQYLAAPIVGDGFVNYPLGPTQTSEDIFFIHLFDGQWYLTAGSGTTLADDGVTALDGGTLLHKRTINNPLGELRIIVGFAEPTDGITGYVWGDLTSALPHDPTAQIDTTLPPAVQGVAYGGAFGSIPADERGTVSLQLMPLVQGRAVTAVPSLTYVSTELPMTVTAGATDISVRGTMTMPLDVVAADTFQNGVAVRMNIAGFGTISGAAFNTPYFDIQFTGLWSTRSYPSGAFDVESVAYAYGDVQWALAVQFEELINAFDGLRTFRQLSVQLAETATISIAQQLAMQSFMAESATASLTTTAIYALRLAEQAVASGAAETYYQAMAEIAERLLVDDNLQDAFTELLADSGTASDVVEILRKLFVELSEAADATDGLESVLTLVVTEMATADASDAAEAVGHYFQNIFELGGAAIGIRLPDTGFVGWVMNTEGQQPVTEYSNFEFNSFAELERTIYAAGEDGIYALGGGDDAGDPIDAAIESLVTAMGTSRQKRVRSAYLGYTADGKLILKIRALSKGVLTEDWYQAIDLNADSPREQFVRLGLGVKSRYWQFELVNVDGADFELDELELHPLVLGRRV